MNCFLEGQQLLQQQRRPLCMFSTASSPPPDDPDDNPLPNCAEPLGRPLPLDEHACSVSLPTWSSVVGYEEGDPRVTSKLTCGYPRFVYHPYILQLMDYVVDTYGSDHQDCLILPSPAAAARCQAFLQQALYGKETTTTNTAGDTTSLNDDNDNDERITRIDLPCNIQAVLFPAETLAGTEAKAYWQHTGEIVSSRRAQVALEELKVEIQHVTPPFEGGAMVQYHHADNRCPTVYEKLKERIANLTKVPASHVHLSPSGMASIYMALRSSQRLKATTTTEHDGGGTSIVFGFPYLDTLKLCSRAEFCPGGVEFFGQGDEADLNKLQTMLEAKKHHKEYCALFTEVPSNPLLRTPNVRRLRELATDHDFALIVDDTIGNFQNVNLLDHKETAADAICTSLTKLFSGRGDVMAGSLVVNPNTDTGAQLQATLEQYKDDNGGLFVADAWAMYHNSQDFVERNVVINDTAERLSDWLKDHSDVQTVYYPKYTKLYQQVHTGRGYGGLLSILLDQHVCQRTFFDALNVSKGPSLGTNFTLMCPYTLLAHYHELDFAMAYNVQPNLLRIAVGLEPYELLKGRFEEAFTKSRLHPPLPKLGAQQLQRRGYSTSAAFSTSTTTRKLARFGVAVSKRLVR